VTERRTAAFTRGALLFCIGALLGTQTAAAGPRGMQQSGIQQSGIHRGGIHHGALDAAGPVSRWPREIPARVLSADDDAASGIAAFALGEVRPPLANARFDPTTDTLFAADGSEVPHYYRDKLGITFYEPLDKTSHPLPPTGWCSWYYFYQEVEADLVLRNARWAAEHLADFGLRYIQIDDGWQGKGRGLGDNRDWFTTDGRFLPIGMDGLAQEIRELGFEAGIWLVPYGQSSRSSIPRDSMILRDAEGEPVRHEWVGDYILDPTAPATKRYMTDLFATFREMGYTYFKTDGFPPSVDIFEGNLDRMQNAPPVGTAPRDAAEVAFREGLSTVRDAIGDESYWLGCWGVELAPIGMVNGGRTAGDVRVTHEGYTYAREAILRWAFLHNIAWMSDPDTLLVRPPLSEGVARSWATALGISGQALMLSDDLPSLPPDRVDMLKRVIPATDIRSIDLYRPENPGKPIWTLTAHRPGDPADTYTVVAVFNGSEHQRDTRLVSWDDLGLSGDAKHHVFDFWRDEYLGAWSDGVFIDVPPGDVRLLSVVPFETDAPVLLSTSRHVTQGWVDLESLRGHASHDGWMISGTSRVVKGDEYRLAFGLPRDGASMELAGFVAAHAGSSETLAARIEHQQGAAVASVVPERTGSVSWEARFLPSDPIRSHPVLAERDITIDILESGDVRATFAIEWVPAAGFEVSLNGEVVGTAFGTSVILRDLVPGREYTVTQRPVWYDGTTSDNSVSATFTIPAGAE